MKQPVSLSLNIEFINFPSFPPVESSKDFASVNLVKGLYSVSYKHLRAHET